MPSPSQDRAPAATPSAPGRRLAQAREQRRLSQPEAAVQSGVSLATIQRLEAGRIYNPGIRTLARLAKLYGYDILDICEPEWLGEEPAASDDG